MALLSTSLVHKKKSAHCLDGLLERDVVIRPSQMFFHVNKSASATKPFAPTSASASKSTIGGPQKKPHLEGVWGGKAPLVVAVGPAKGARSPHRAPGDHKNPLHWSSQPGSWPINATSPNLPSWPFASPQRFASMLAKIQLIRDVLTSEICHIA